MTETSFRCPMIAGGESESGRNLVNAKLLDETLTLNGDAFEVRKRKKENDTAYLQAAFCSLFYYHYDESTEPDESCVLYADFDDGARLTARLKYEGDIPVIELIAETKTNNLDNAACGEWTRTYSLPRGEAWECMTDETIGKLDELLAAMTPLDQ